MAKNPILTIVPIRQVPGTQKRNEIDGGEQATRRRFDQEGCM
jgi:hypothetical protein